VVSKSKQSKAWKRARREEARRREKVRLVLNVNSDAFLCSFEWRKVRMEALKLYGARCQCCGASAATGAVINVDHIKPRRLFPSLALDLDNLQVLCDACNQGKGSWDMTDWRPEDTSLPDDQRAHLREILNGC